MYNNVHYVNVGCVWQLMTHSLYASRAQQTEYNFSTISQTTKYITFWDINSKRLANDYIRHTIDKL